MKLFLTFFCALLCLCTSLESVRAQTGAEAQVLAYPGDCSKYQHCDGSGCFVLSCSPGTEFNPAIGTCDYPLMDRRNCQNRGY